MVDCDFLQHDISSGVKIASFACVSLTYGFGMPIVGVALFVIWKMRKVSFRHLLEYLRKCVRVFARVASSWRIFKDETEVLFAFSGLQFMVAPNIRLEMAFHFRSCIELQRAVSVGQFIRSRDAHLIFARQTCHCVIFSPETPPCVRKSKFEKIAAIPTCIAMWI